jgi:hypothetical protein
MDYCVKKYIWMFDHTGSRGVTQDVDKAVRMYHRALKVTFFLGISGGVAFGTSPLNIVIGYCVVSCR